MVQLTLGAPQYLYYGCFMLGQVRYFDAEKRRPGLPPEVAALVESIEIERTIVHLVNLSPFESRIVLLQAGTLGEHRFKQVSYRVRTSEYPGRVGSYAAPHLATRTETQAVDDKYTEVELPPTTEIRLEFERELFTNRPSYALPWYNPPV